MRLFRMIRYYLTSSVKQHLGSMLWFVLILSASSFVLLLFYGEKLREDTVSEVIIRFLSEDGSLVVTEEQLGKLDELNEKYRTRAIYVFYPSEIYVSGVQMEELGCMYPETYVYFHKEEEQERSRILLTDRFSEGETVEIGEVTLQVKHINHQKFARIPYWVLVDTGLPIVYFETTFWNISLKKLSEYENSLRELFPGLTVYNSEVGNEAAARRRMDIMYLMLVVLALANISYSYWYCLEKRKKMVKIFFVVGSSRYCRNMLMLLELLIYHVISSLIGMIIYTKLYGALYQYNIVSYPQPPETEIYLRTALISGALVILIFGGMCALYNRRIEKS